MIIFLTGSRGFIGSVLRSYLQDRGHIVKVVPSGDLIAASAFSQAKFDIYLFDKIGPFDCILHCAGMAHRVGRGLSWADYYLSNVHLSHRLASSASASAFCKQFIFLSSSKVYGSATIGEERFSPDSKCFPACLYGHSKFQAELAIASACQRSDLPYTFLRPPLLYGPNVKANFLLLLKLAYLGFPDMFSRVDNIRSFLSLDNLCSLIDVLLLNPLAFDLRLNVFDSLPLSTSFLFNEISSNFGRHPFPVPIPGRLLRAVFSKSPLVSSFVLDDSLLGSRLGWNPPVSTVDGLRSVCSWYLSEVAAFRGVDCQER